MRSVYLAVVTDLFARKRVGWALSISPENRCLRWPANRESNSSAPCVSLNRGASTQVLRSDSYCGASERCRSQVAAVIAGMAHHHNAPSCA